MHLRLKNITTFSS